MPKKIRLKVRRCGRPRNATAERTSGGRIRRAADPIIPQAVIERRLDLYGVAMSADPARAARERASLAADGAFGTAYGMLWRAGVIDDAQHAAAERLESAWRRWSILVGAPARTPIRRDSAGSAPEPDDDALDRARRVMERTMHAVRQSCAAGTLAWSLVEGVVADGVIPPRLLRAGRIDATAWPDGMRLLRTALDAAGTALGVTREAAA